MFIFCSMLSRAPVSSPTLTMFVTMGGNNVVFSKLYANGFPSTTSSCAFLTAFPITAFPVDLDDKAKPSTIGTPEVNKEPSVVVKREIATFFKRLPIIGIF